MELMEVMQYFLWQYLEDLLLCCMNNIYQWKSNEYGILPVESTLARGNMILVLCTLYRFFGESDVVSDLLNQERCQNVQRFLFFFFLIPIFFGRTCERRRWWIWGWRCC